MTNGASTHGCGGGAGGDLMCEMVEAMTTFGKPGHGRDLVQPPHEPAKSMYPEGRDYSWDKMSAAGRAANIALCHASPRMGG